MVGDEVYGELAGYLDQRVDAAPRIGFLPIV